MSAFLHQIFYANNKFGHDSPEHLYAFIEELSKWSTPLSGDGLPSKDNYLRRILSFDGKPSPDNPPSPSFVPHSGLVVMPDNLFSVEKTIITGITFDGKPSPVIPRFTTFVPHSTNTTLSFEDKSSPDNPSSPSFVPHSGLVAKSGVLEKEKPPDNPKTSHSLFDKPARPVHSRIPSNLSIFQSMFLLHYGYSEYIMAGNRMLNRELEEKQKIMETLSKTPKKLKEGNHKITNDNIQEILSGLLVSTKEEIMHLVAYSSYYNRIIYLVFTHSYLVFSPTKETAVDSENIQSVYILNQTRKHPKYGGSYYPDLEPTLEKLENIHNSKIHLEHYAKPFKGVSAYKLPELEEMATKTGVFENGVPVKYKKKELYDKIVEVCCAGISA
jgi:hypothetical protein